AGWESDPRGQVAPRPARLLRRLLRRSLPWDGAEAASKGLPTAGFQPARLQVATLGERDPDAGAPAEGDDRDLRPLLCQLVLLNFLAEQVKAPVEHAHRLTAHRARRIKQERTCDTRVGVGLIDTRTEVRH